MSRDTVSFQHENDKLVGVLLQSLGLLFKVRPKTLKNQWELVKVAKGKILHYNTCPDFVPLGTYFVAKLNKKIRIETVQNHTFRSPDYCHY